MTDAKLKSLAERIERLMDERDGIGADIRDIFTEAKSAGYVPKVLRKAITRKRMDPSKRDEEDTILELYEGALGAVGKAVAAVRAGSTWNDAAKEHNVPRATLARAVAVSKRREETRSDTDDPTTGEIKDTAAEDPPGALAGTPDVTSRAGSERANDEARQGGDGCGATCGIPNGAYSVGVNDRNPEVSLSSQPEAFAPAPQPLAYSTDALSAQQESDASAGITPDVTTELTPEVFAKSANRSPTVEIGAVAAQPRVASPEIDLTPPPALIEKRREIEARRGAPS